MKWQGKVVECAKFDDGQSEKMETQHLPRIGGFACPHANKVRKWLKVLFLMHVHFLMTDEYMYSIFLFVWMTNYALDK